MKLNRYVWFTAFALLFCTSAAAFCRPLTVDILREEHLRSGLSIRSPGQGFRISCFNCGSRTAEKRRRSYFITHDVEEALILADKVIVLGLNPGIVKAEVPVNIPRPRRRAEIYNNPKFQELHSQLINHMHENIMEHLDADQTAFPLGDKI